MEGFVERLVLLARRANPGFPPRAVIFDIDSTLASGRWRWDFVEGPIRDWGAWNSHMVLDAPIAHTVRRLKQHRDRGDRIILMSMRSDRFMEATMTWLRGHDIPYDELHLRPDSARGTTEELKRDLYRREIAGRYDIVAAYDDDADNVAMWQSEGIPARQVTDPGVPPLEGLPRPDPRYPSGRREYWGMGGEGVVFRDGAPFIYILPYDRVNEHGNLEHVDGYWKELEMSQPLDRLLLKLAHRRESLRKFARDGR